MRGHSMLDCPEQSQTSPMRMSETVISSAPFTIKVSGVAQASIAGSCSDQRPSSAVMVVAEKPLRETAIFSEGSADPHISMGCCLWKMAPSEKMGGSEGLARS